MCSLLSRDRQTADPTWSKLNLWRVFNPVYMVVCPGDACLFTMFQIAFIDRCPPRGEKKSSEDSFQHVGRSKRAAAEPSISPAAFWQRIEWSAYTWLLKTPTIRVCVCAVELSIHMYWEDPTSTDPQDGFTVVLYCNRCDFQQKSTNQPQWNHFPPAQTSSHDTTKWPLLTQATKFGASLMQTGLRFAQLTMWILTDWCMSQWDMSILEVITSPSWLLLNDRRHFKTNGSISLLWQASWLAPRFKTGPPGLRRQISTFTQRKMVNISMGVLKKRKKRIRMRKRMINGPVEDSENCKVKKLWGKDLGKGREGWYDQKNVYSQRENVTVKGVSVCTGETSTHW